MLLVLVLVAVAVAAAAAAAAAAVAVAVGVGVAVAVAVAVVVVVVVAVAVAVAVAVVVVVVVVVVVAVAVVVVVVVVVVSCFLFLVVSNHPPFFAIQSTNQRHPQTQNDAVETQGNTQGKQCPNQIKGHDAPDPWENLFHAINGLRKKHVLLSIESWLVNRDPYFMVY